MSSGQVEALVLDHDRANRGAGNAPLARHRTPSGSGFRQLEAGHHQRGPVAGGNVEGLHEPRPRAGPGASASPTRTEATSDVGRIAMRSWGCPGPGISRRFDCGHNARRGTELLPCGYSILVSWLRLQATGISILVHLESAIQRAVLTTCRCNCRALVRVAEATGGR